jgi:hypothetical protein
MGNGYDVARARFVDLGASGETSTGRTKMRGVMRPKDLIEEL